ncbi:Gram-negative bacterial tonB protein [compost metagenome]
MKKLILLFAIIFIGFFYGQTTEKTEEILNKDASNSIDQSVHPEFQGGLPAFRNAFSENFDSDNLKGKGVFKTQITFTVDENGNVSDLIAKGENISLNKAAVNAVKKIKGKWNPGILRGNPVKSTFTFPVTMNLQ